MLDTEDVKFIFINSFSITLRQSARYFALNAMVMSLPLRLIARFSFILLNSDVPLIVMTFSFTSSFTRLFFPDGWEGSLCLNFLQTVFVYYDVGNVVVGQYLTIIYEFSVY